MFYARLPWQRRFSRHYLRFSECYKFHGLPLLSLIRLSFPHPSLTNKSQLVFQTTHYPLTMPSFTQVTALAAVAFAAFTNAAPVVRADPTPLPAIFTQMVSDLTPVTSALSSIDSSNATEAVVGPLTNQVTTILTGAVSEISALAGSPLSTILSTADGVISVTDAANLLAPVLTMVYGAAQDVLNVVDSSPAASVITPLLNEAIGALDPVLSTAAPLVDGLFAALAPIVGPVVNTLNGLGLGPVVSLLGSLI
ncbi:hypothetical protein MSAN_00449100 [Mycena sanguinolenta]|uniref:Uncharacterized protein n=1 Tax=Mycena sanguinolenta TaxID=230812 RepID=A0A8H6ZHD6_9AGAR|nr:hypothetical protein MSAN_00449100 [Mycena sanguinolenta]